MVKSLRATGSLQRPFVGETRDMPRAQLGGFCDLDLTDAVGTEEGSIYAGDRVAHRVTPEPQ
jgi:hypothetical protein